MMLSRHFEEWHDRFSDPTRQDSVYKKVVVSFENTNEVEYNFLGHNHECREICNIHRKSVRRRLPRVQELQFPPRCQNCVLERRIERPLVDDNAVLSISEWQAYKKNK